jgi:hypothetical protein
MRKVHGALARDDMVKDATLLETDERRVGRILRRRREDFR